MIVCEGVNVGKQIVQFEINFSKLISFTAACQTGLRRFCTETLHVFHVFEHVFDLTQCAPSLFNNDRVVLLSDVFLYCFHDFPPCFRAFGGYQAVIHKRPGARVSPVILWHGE